MRVRGFHLVLCLPWFDLEFHDEPIYGYQHGTTMIARIYMMLNIFLIMKAEDGSVGISVQRSKRYIGTRKHVKHKDINSSYVKPFLNNFFTGFESENLLR